MSSHRADATGLNEKISQAQKNRSRLACVSCRARRIKCDGQVDGCERCLAAGITDCRYEKVNLAERVASRKRKRETRGKKKEESPDSSRLSAPSTFSEPLPEMTSGSDSREYLGNSQTGSLQSSASLLLDGHKTRLDTTMPKHQYARNLRHHHHFQQNAYQNSNSSSSSSSALLSPLFPSQSSSAAFAPTDRLLLQDGTSPLLSFHEPYLSSDGLNDMTTFDALAGRVPNRQSLRSNAESSSYVDDASPIQALVRHPTHPSLPLSQEQTLQYQNSTVGRQNQHVAEEEVQQIQGDTRDRETARLTMQQPSGASDGSVPFSFDTSWVPHHW